MKWNYKRDKYDALAAYNAPANENHKQGVRQFPNLVQRH